MLLKVIPLLLVKRCIALNQVDKPGKEQVKIKYFEKGYACVLKKQVATRVPGARSRMLLICFFSKSLLGRIAPRLG